MKFINNKSIRLANEKKISLQLQGTVSIRKN